jgi:hypothetical protein
MWNVRELGPGYLRICQAPIFVFAVLNNVRLHFVWNFSHTIFFTKVLGAASNYAYYGYPELWILRCPAHRYHAMPSPGFEPTTLRLSPTSKPFGHDASHIIQV